MDRKRHSFNYVFLGSGSWEGFVWRRGFSHHQAHTVNAGGPERSPAPGQGSWSVVWCKEITHDSLILPCLFCDKGGQLIACLCPCQAVDNTPMPQWQRRELQSQLKVLQRQSNTVIRKMEIKEVGDWDTLEDIRRPRLFTWSLMCVVP